jgi:hypothetical protein
MNHAAAVVAVAGDADEVADALTKRAARSVQPSAEKTTRKKPVSRANRENSASRVNHVAAAAVVPADQAVRGEKIRVAAHRKTTSMMTVSKKSSSTIRKMKLSTAA